MADGTAHSKAGMFIRADSNAFSGRTIYTGGAAPTVEQFGTTNGEGLNDVPTMLGEE
jgi:hypothetical protein